MERIFRFVKFSFRFISEFYFYIKVALILKKQQLRYYIHQQISLTVEKLHFLILYGLRYLRLSGSCTIAGY